MERLEKAVPERGPRRVLQVERDRPQWRVKCVQGNAPPASLPPSGSPASFAAAAAGNATGSWGTVATATAHFTKPDLLRPVGPAEIASRERQEAVKRQEVAKRLE